MSSIPSTVAVILAAVAAPAFAQPTETPLTRGNGCDGLVGNASGVSTYGTATVNGQVLRSFAVGTNTWNIGNRPMEWVSTGSNHPKLFQNVYRAKGKQFHHVALGWGKRGFAVANGTINSGFGPCVTATTGTMPSKLGISCTDPYGASTNAGQGNLGPRFDVNPITGAFTAGNATGLIPAAANTNIDRRCVGLDSDFQAPAATGATFYAEAFVVTPDDAQWGNSRNNYSTRKLAPFPTLNPGNTSQNITFATTPNYRCTALEHFAADTPGVNLTFTDFHERNNTFMDKYESWESPETTIVVRATPVSATAQANGRFITASSATDNGDGTWTYDYAVMNVNSHRSGGSARFKLPAGADVTGQSSFAPMYHSGDRFRNTPWSYDKNDSRVLFSVDPATEQRAVTGVGTVTFNPNAIMFGAVHSYRFTVNKPPTTGWFHLGFFRPAADAFGYQGSSLAITNAIVPAACLVDVGGRGGLSGPDNELDNNDFIVFIDQYFAGELAVADVGKQGGIAGPDNKLDNNDFIVFIEAFFTGCV